jgi:predicted metal-binding transcription factor (methanogenesis marker protein 9)
MRASWETVMRRTLLIAQSDCSPAEYRRMVKEKAEAVAGFQLGSDRQRRQSVRVFAPDALVPPSECQCKALTQKVDERKPVPALSRRHNDIGQIG